MDAKFDLYLTQIVENPRPEEVVQAWINLIKLKRLESLDYKQEYYLNYEKLLAILLTKKRIVNVNQVAKLLDWFSNFIRCNDSRNNISNDIAYFLTASAQHFKEQPCLAEITGVIYNNRSKYLSRNDNSDLCRAIIEVLFWIRLPKDINKYNEDFTKIRDFLKFLCKQENEITKNLAVNCFRTMCTIFLKNDRTEDPSPALLIVFQVVEEQLWNNHMNSAVEQILTEISDENKIIEMLSLFCKWIVQCPDSNKNYLSTWLTSFISSLDQNLPGCKMVLKIAELALPEIFSGISNLSVFYAINMQRNIIYQLLIRLDSVEVLHKIMPKVFKLLNPQELKLFNTNMICDIKKLKKYLFKNFKSHFRESCSICENLKKLLFNDNSQSNDFQTQEESEEMEISYPTTSIGLGKLNNVKVGLLNLGNTCYMNSVLQALAMTSQFCHEVLLYKSKDELSNDTVLKNLQNLFALLKYTEENSLSPKAILYASKPSYFMPGHQQDSSEFLCHLLDVMYEQEKSMLMQSNTTDQNTNTMMKADDKEMVTEDSAVALTSPMNEDGTSLNMQRWNTEENLSEGEELGQTQNGLSDSHSDSTDSGIQSVGGEDSTSSSVSLTSSPSAGTSSATSNLVHRVFGGELKVTYQCISCNTKSDNTDKFTDLQLCFLDNLTQASEISVQDLINMNYFLPENLTGDNKYRCDKCDKLCDAQRIIKIQKVPAHLILTLKHFRYDSESRLRAKLRRKVFYNETIQLPVLEKPKETYRLYAAVVHCGYNMDFGHYITYACDSRNIWYKFNDSYVTQSSIEELKRLEPPDTPYILFYKKCGDTLEADAPEFSSLSKSLRDRVEQKRRYLKDHRAAVSKIPRHNVISSKLNNFREKDRNDDEDDNPPPSSCRAAFSISQQPCLL